jgi:hypothetical protein
MTRNHQKWTAEEEEKLLNSSSDFPKIANELQRTVDAVQCRFTKLYISLRAKEMLYDRDGKFDKKALELHFDNFVNRYAEFYKINKNKLVRFLTYADRKLRRALVDIKTLKELDNKPLSNSQTGSDTGDETDADSDSDDETYYPSEDDSSNDDSSDDDSSDDDSSNDDSSNDDSSDDEESYAQSMQNANKWKLKYYKLKYEKRLNIINNLLNK